MDYFWNHSFDCSSKFIFSAGYYTGSFGILGTPDGWDYKMGILLFPILQFFLLFLTGRKKVKDFMFRFARTPLNSIQYNWAVDGLLLFIFFVEIWIITEAFRYR